MKKSNLKLKLIFSDRVGIAADVASQLSKQRVNIVFFEMDVFNGQATIHLELETGTAADWGRQVDSLRDLPGLLEITRIEILPREEREKRLQVALDSISDGILGVDHQGKVVIINRVAQHILGYDDREIIGVDFRQLKRADLRLEDCLEGKSFVNEKRNLITTAGRFQFLATSKPILNSAGRVVGAVEIMRDMEELKELSAAVSQPNSFSFSDMVGRSPVLMEAIAFAQKIARAESVVSVFGESGTGKELFARAIHTESQRDGLFVPINCAALPEALLESELFGYVGGAFSGAQREGKPGLFEVAGEGTLFLDEIAEMPLSLQAKMLRVLQEKKVRRVGGSREIPVNVRIITATNKNLAEMVSNKLFREDLYYRINVFPIFVPPLRERREDIVPLAEHFLFHMNARLEEKWQTFSAQALEKLKRQRWSGNIRELKNVVERAAVLSDLPEIDASNVFVGDEFGRAIQLPVQNETGSRDGVALPELVAQLEIQHIAAALCEAKSKRQAARHLGLTHTALLNRIKKYRLNVE